MPRLVKGSDLTPKQREHVLRAYVHRWTHENPHRVQVYRDRGKLGIPLVHDDQWLREHAFYINANGDLSARHTYCVPEYMVKED